MWEPIPELGRSPGEWKDTPLQCSCLGNPKDRGVWRAIVHGVPNSQMWLSMHACIQGTKTVEATQAKGSLVGILVPQPGSELGSQQRNCYSSLDQQEIPSALFFSNVWFLCSWEPWINETDPGWITLWNPAGGLSTSGSRVFPVYESPTTKLFYLQLRTIVF